MQSINFLKEMAKKKGKVEDLEEVFEEVEEQSSSITDLIENNRTLLIGLGVALVAAVAGVLFYQYNLQSKNQDANRELFRAIQYFEADSFEKALNGDDQYPGFLEIEESYGGTAAANLAKYYLGIIYLKTDSNEVETGIDYLKSFDKKFDSPLSMAAYMALGFAHEELTDFEAAAGYFEDAIGSVGRENESMVPTLLMHVGRNYEASGQTDKALQAYERVKVEFPLSSEGLRIDKYIGRVSS